jgi:hypothetical protein
MHYLNAKAWNVKAFGSRERLKKCGLPPVPTHYEENWQKNKRTTE